jgi:aminoglycoside phosphotransferase (APT) family kinase protein
MKDGRRGPWTACGTCPRLALVPSIPIPTTLEELLDQEWLSRALSDITDEDRIVDVEAVESSKTLAQKVQFRVTVAGPGGQHTRSYCVKAHFDEPSGSTLLSEARFYHELEPLLDVRTPRAYYADVDEAAGQAMIIMDDVVDIGGRFLRAHTPYSLETARDSLGQLARLHASTWDGTRTAGLGWLAPRIRAMAELFPAELLQTLLDDGRGVDIPPELRDAKNLVGALQRTSDHEITCVIHGDTHSGNVYLDREGRACWLDWQIVQHGNWATDISYHLATVLDVETRREHEGDLLRHYLHELESGGVVVPPWEEAWEKYTLSFSYGYFLWVITQISSRAVVMVHIPRLAAALTDHDTFRRLGVV